MERNHRTGSIVMILVGLLAIIVAYEIHEIDEKKAYVQQHSPAISMPIVSRIKGMGTVRSPNKIYVWHNGQRYTIETGNRYFRKMAKADSVKVNFDPVQNIAVLAEAKVKTPYFLLGLILVTGVFLVGFGAWQLTKKETM
ncbi:hypothetical protein [Runella sp.]|uniref:hypothetical protein n=1 Tax=Runella sp. TaxID=1960881 RepID=UPI003D0C372A